MATATERKFTNLRKRLDQLGYRQSLGVESLPLVEKLFGDLLQTTESLKSAKQQLGRQQEQKTVWEQQVEPYRADNARVVQENTKLHQQLLRLKESAESRMRDLKTVLRRLEHENADLKFLNTQYVTKMRSLERESEAKSERLLALHQKSCEAVIRTPGGKKRQVPLRRQRMEVDSLLHPSSATHKDGWSEKPARIPSPDPYVADLLQVADKRIAQLQASLETADSEKEELLQALQGLRQQVENRESEIERLAGMLKGGRPPEALAVEGARASNERMVAHLNIQVDFLQQANQDLESKLKDAESANGDLQGRVQELSGKNAKICEELSEIGELVKQLEAEREGGEEKYREKIAELEARAEGLEEERQEFASKLDETRRVREEVTTDNRRLAEIIVVMEGEGEEAAAMLESLRRERKELRRECVQLRERESSLQRRVSELERSGGQNFPGGSASQGEVRRICRERDQLKEATSQMEAELIQIQSDAKSLATDRDNFKLLYEQVQEEVRRLRLEPHGAQGSTTLVQRLEKERDDAQRELRKVCREVKTLRERLHQAQSSNTPPHTHTTDGAAQEDRLADLQHQLEEVCRERDELQEKVSVQRHAILSLQQEAESSSQALSVAGADASRLRSKVAQLQGMLDAGERGREQIERERRKEARKVEKSHSVLSQSANRIAELGREVGEREERVMELRGALSSLDQEHDSLRRETDGKDETIQQLQEQLTEKEAGASELRDSIERLRSELSRQQSQDSSRHRELVSLQSQLKECRRDLASVVEEREKRGQEGKQLREELELMVRENQAVHEELRRALTEKEALSRRVEECARNMLQYQEMVASKEQETADLVQSYQALSDGVEQLQSSSRYNLGEIATAKAEVAALTQTREQLEDVIEQQAGEIQQHLHSLSLMEQQISSLTLALAKMEAALRQEVEEKKALVSDLAATRELCVQLDKTKESLTRQLASQGIGLEQQQAQLEDLKSERELLKQQLVSERNTNESLQVLLSGERRKEFHIAQSGQEKELEIQHLRRQLARLETDRLSLQEQLRSVHSQLASQGEELQRVKIELGTEKFQKEKLIQQAGGSSPAHFTGYKTTSTLVTVGRKQDRPIGKQATNSPGGDELFTKERDSLASESEKLVGELMKSPPPHSSPNSHSSSSHPPPPHTFQSPPTSL